MKSYRKVSVLLLSKFLFYSILLKLGQRSRQKWGKNSHVTKQPSRRCHGAVYKYSLIIGRGTKGRAVIGSRCPLSHQWLGALFTNCCESRKLTFSCGKQTQRGIFKSLPNRWEIDIQGISNIGAIYSGARKEIGGFFFIFKVCNEDNKRLFVRTQHALTRRNLTND